MEKITHTEKFIVAQIGPIETLKGLNGLPYQRRFVGLRNIWEDNENHIHQVLFLRSGVSHTERLSDGVTIDLTFSIGSSLSRAGIAHSHIIPHQFTIIKQ